MQEYLFVRISVSNSVFDLSMFFFMNSSYNHVIKIANSICGLTCYVVDKQSKMLEYLCNPTKNPVLTDVRKIPIIANTNLISL